MRAIFGDFLANLDVVGVDVVKWNREGDEIGEGGKLYLYTVGQGHGINLGHRTRSEQGRVRERHRNGRLGFLKNSEYVATGNTPKKVLLSSVFFDHNFVWGIWVQNG